MRQICNLQNLEQELRKTRSKRGVKRYLRAVYPEKGALSWLSVIPIQDQGYDLNKSEFKDAIKMRYNWKISDLPKTCVCRDIFDVDHAMICKRGGFVIQRHNELRHLEAELHSTVCKDVQVEPVLQQVTGETLNRGANRAPDARLDIRARRFCERQRSAFFDVRDATQMQILIANRTPNKSTSNTRMKRNASTVAGSWRLSKEHLRL